MERRIKPKKRPCCYLCTKPFGKGNWHEKTKDHVPPDSWFVDVSKVPNLITVQCCTKCRDKWTVEDERIRPYFLVPEGTCEDADKIFKGAVMRSLKGSEKLQHEFMKYIKDDWRMQNGIWMPQQRTDLPTARVAKYLTRFTKAFLAYFHPEYNYFRDKFLVQYGPFTGEHLNLLVGLYHQMRYDSRGSAINIWRVLDDKRGLWVIQFFEGPAFSVLHAKPKKKGR